MSVTVATAPTKEPLTVDELQEWTRITDEFDGATIERTAKRARRFMEDRLCRALMTQTIVERCDRFPGWMIELNRAPVQSVTSIQYLDGAGVLQTLSSSLYVVDIYSEPARITPLHGSQWPTTDIVMNAVTITYVAGYTTAELVPDSLQQALSMLVAHWLEHREAITELRLDETPIGYEPLTWPYQLFK